MEHTDWCKICWSGRECLEQKYKRRDDLRKKVVNKLKHKYPGMEFINIRDSESVQLCEKRC